MEITFDNYTATITDVDPVILSRLRKHFSMMAPGALYTYEYKLYKKTHGRAGKDGKAYLVDPGGSFLTGLVPTVFNKCVEYGETPILIDKRHILPPNLQKSAVPLYDYQKEAVTSALHNGLGGHWWPRGIIKIATGGGKTEIAVDIFQKNPLPTLFLVHRKELLTQTVRRFEGYGISCNVIGGGTKEIGCSGVTVATIQTLASIIRQGTEHITAKKIRHEPTVKQEELKGDLLQWLETINQVFFDEAHLLAAKLEGGNQFIKFNSYLPNAYCKWGLTATPLMKDGYSDGLLMGATGGVLYDIGSALLIEKGRLTPPNVIMRKAPTPSRPTPRKWPDCYEFGVVLNKERNNMIVEDVKNLPYPCLVMVNRVVHGERIYNQLVKSNLNVEFCQGATSKEERQSVIDSLKAGTTDIVVCSTIWDEGVDIPNLRALVLAGAGKSQIKLLQRIGRGLRVSKGKKVVEVRDYYDTSSVVLLRHSKMRKNVWEEQGFTPKLENK